MLSLGETHSFELAGVARMLSSASVEDVLVQAVLDAPLFTTRWRWNASISLAIRRNMGGKRTPAPLQRMAAEDLIAVVFPQQLACAENVTGAREIPDHPLVKQTLDDCLHEAMDLDGLKTLLEALESGATSVVPRDLPSPSPLAAEILTARPYAYRRRAARGTPDAGRRGASLARPESAADIGQLDPAAHCRGAHRAWPTAENADELHDALISLGCLTAVDSRAFRAGNRSCDTSFAAKRDEAHGSRSRLLVAAETLPMLLAVYPSAAVEPRIDVPFELVARTWAREDALIELVRGRLQGVGPVTTADVANALDLGTADVEKALIALESEGFVLHGRFTTAEINGRATDVPASEWCERRLLAGIHRYTIRTLRAEIEPVSSADFMRFLLEWQGVTSDPRPQGIESLAAIIAQLEGYEVPAAAWESDVLTARLAEYDPNWLDNLCLSGRALWADSRRPRARPRRPCAPRRSRCLRAGTGHYGARCPTPRAAKSRCRTVRAQSPSTSARVGRRSSTTSSAARGCSSPSARPRWPNSWPPDS